MQHKPLTLTAKEPLQRYCGHALFKRVPSPHRQCSMLTRRSWRATQQRGTSLTSWCSPTTAQRVVCASSTAPSTTVRGTHHWPCLIPLEAAEQIRHHSGPSVANRDRGYEGKREEVLLEPSSLQLYLSHQEVWQHVAQPGHVQAGTKNKKKLFKKTTLNPRVLSGGMLI